MAMSSFQLASQPRVFPTVDPEAKTGDFFGPAGGKRALSGPAVKLEPEEALTSPENKKVLWEESCKATGISPESFGMA